MAPSTRELWARQDRHPGDRERLFRAVADEIDVARVLYPGSYVDLAASFVWPEVTYVDLDRRAARFFADTDGVAGLLTEHGVDPAGRRLRFLPADYRDRLDLDDGSVDLLVSLYAGLVSEHCTRYLRRGGWLLVNPSHGDVAVAAADSRYALAGVVQSRSGGYAVRGDDLESYLVPKREVADPAEEARRTGRGIGYTRSPFGYLFRRVA